MRSITVVLRKKAFAEIEANIVPHHLPEARERRLVEAELLVELGDQLRIEPLGAAIFGTAVIDSLLGETIGAAGQAACGIVGLPGELCDNLFDRAARRELDDGEGNRHDADDGRDHQQQTSEDIGAHQPCSLSKEPMPCLAFLAWENPPYDHRIRPSFKPLIPFRRIGMGHLEPA